MRRTGLDMLRDAAECLHSDAAPMDCDKFHEYMKRRRELAQEIGAYLRVVDGKESA